MIRLVLYRGETRRIEVWKIAESAEGRYESRISEWQGAMGPLVLDNAEMHVQVILREVRHHSEH